MINITLESIMKQLCNQHSDAIKTVPLLCVYTDISHTRWTTPLLGQYIQLYKNSR